MTVLQALDRYYERMARRGEVEPPGWSREKISFAIVLSRQGEPIDVLDLRQASGRKLAPRLVEVPAPPSTRTSKVQPNLLWDKTAYVLGRTAGSGKRTAEEHAAFKEYHLRLLDGTQDDGLLALRRFLEVWTPERFEAPPFVTEMLDTNLIFRLEGDLGFIHEREAARHLVGAQAGGTGPRGFCLVTGMEAPLTRLHPPIKGVEDAQPRGALLVSFNEKAFESYGKKQGENAPTSDAAAFRYGAALNRMLDRGSRNRLTRPIGDATTVFWADASDEVVATTAEDDFRILFDPPAADQGADRLDRDMEHAIQLFEALRQVAEGRPARDLDLHLVEGVRLHVLGLSPNDGRLSVRFWLTDSFGVFTKRLADHYACLRIEPSPWRLLPPSVRRLLVQATVSEKAKPHERYKRVPPLLGGEVTRAILNGTPYPRTLLTTTLIRLRAGDNPRTGWHAAAIRAVLNRSCEEKVPMALDPENPNVAYQLGRLFAVLEAAQYTALGRVNAPIGDRYYAAASATPARVFASLIRAARNHIADARKRGLGGWIESKLNEIMARLPPDIPATLRLEDQGRFAVGYYHERAYRPEKAKSPDAEEQNDE